MGMVHGIPPPLDPRVLRAVRRFQISSQIGGSGNTSPLTLFSQPSKMVFLGFLKIPLTPCAGKCPKTPFLPKNTTFPRILVKTFRFNRHYSRGLAILIKMLRFCHQKVPISWHFRDFPYWFARKSPLSLRKHCFWHLFVTVISKGQNIDILEVLPEF